MGPLPPDRPLLEDSGHDEEQHHERRQHAQGRVKPEDANRLEFAHDERHQANRRGARREAAGEPAERDRPRGHAPPGTAFQRLDQIVDEVNTARHAEGEHQKRHHDQDRIHPVTPGVQKREREPHAGQRHEKHENRIGERTERPPGEGEDHQRRRNAVGVEARGTRTVDRHVVDHRPGQVEVLLPGGRRLQEGAFDPGDGPAAVDEPRTGKGNDEAGRSAVGSDEHSLEPLEGGVAIERQGRSGEPLEDIGARGDRFKPEGAGGIAGGFRTGGHADEASGRRGVERAARPGGDDDVAAFKLPRELVVGLPRWKPGRHPFQRRCRIDAEDTDRRRGDPRAASGQRHQREQAHGQQPRPVGGRRGC